jgi:hypothetical protein
MIQINAGFVRGADQMAAAALPQAVFAGILGLINTLRGPSVTTVSV